MDADLLAFARYFAGRLRLLRPHDYAWDFHLIAPPHWVPPILARGESLEAADALLACSADKFARSLAANDGEGLRQAIEVIMRWGGRWCTQGVQAGNDIAISALPADVLLADVQRDYNFLQARRYASVGKMNAGWTKVWATVFTDGRFVMYDSRVSTYFAKNVLHWERHGGSDAAGRLRKRLRQTPSLEPVRRYPAAVNAAQWSCAMADASAVVHEVIRLVAEEPEFQNSWLDGLTPRGLEARLFMLGA